MSFIVAVTLNFNEISPEKLAGYKAYFKNFLDKIGADIETFYDATSPEAEAATRFRKNIQNEEFWSLTGIVPNVGSRIDSTSIHLKAESSSKRKKRDTTYSFIDAESVFSALNVKLNEVSKHCREKISEAVEANNPSEETKWREKQAECIILKVTCQFLQLQAKSVVAEVGSLHFIEMFKKNLNPNALEAVKDELEKLEECFKKYSFYDEKYIEKHSSNDAMKNRSDAKKHIDNIKKTLSDLYDRSEKPGHDTIPAMPKDHYLKHLEKPLNQAETLFQAKNNINIAHPTEISLAKARREQVQNIFEKITLISGLFSIGFTTLSLFPIPFIHIITIPAAIITGAISGTAGWGVTVLSVGNVIDNMNKGVLPTFSEVVDVVSTSSSFVANVGSHTGKVIGKMVNSTVSIATNAVDLGEAIRKFHEQKDEVQKIIEENQQNSGKAPVPGKGGAGSP